MEDNGRIREFGTGATRDTSVNKPAYGGFLCPRVLQAYGRYMNKHRKQSDGTLRDPDNWQHGIPRGVYFESLLRHVLDLWLYHRGLHPTDRDTGEELTLDDICCAIMFNIMGYLHEAIKAGESR